MAGKGFSPIIIDDFRGLVTRDAPEIVSPDYLINAHNIRYRAEEITIRPGLTIAIEVPIADD